MYNPAAQVSPARGAGHSALPTTPGDQNRSDLAKSFRVVRLNQPVSLAPTMEHRNRKYAVSLMLDRELHARLGKVSEKTQFSMSLLVRLSAERLLREVGDPENPSIAVLTKLLEESRASASGPNRQP